MMRVSILICALIVSGCSVFEVSETSRHSHAGESFDTQWVDQLVVGKTRRYDVLDRIGPPDKTRFEDDQLIYTYDINKERQRRVKILLLLDHESRNESHRELEIRFVDDVVASGRFVIESRHPKSLRPLVYP